MLSGGESGNWDGGGGGPGFLREALITFRNGGGDGGGGIPVLKGNSEATFGVWFECGEEFESVDDGMLSFRENGRDF